MIYRETFLEINLDTLHQNIKKILSYKKGSFAFVLKANSYGLGAKVIAKELENYDKIEYIAVATLNEAIHIKDTTRKPIWILGYLRDDLLLEAIKHNFAITLSDINQIQLIKEKTISFINVDTGFHRYGIKPDSVLIENLKQNPNIILNGIYTHLKLSDKHNDIIQVNKLKQLNINLPISISDSIAYIRHNFEEESLYRIGALLYGLTQKRDENILQVMPVFSLKTSINRIEELDEDTTIGYSNKIYPKHTRIATIPIGYADGLNRDMKDAYVTINQQQAPYIGILSMDHAMIDITGLDVSLYDEVVILGQNGISVEALSYKLKTNKNEILSKLSSRIPRIYTKENIPVILYDELGGVYYED